MAQKPPRPPATTPRSLAMVPNTKIDLLQATVKANDYGENDKYGYVENVSMAAMFCFVAGSERFFPLHAESQIHTIYNSDHSVLYDRICSSNSGLFLYHPYTVINPFIPTAASFVLPHLALSAAEYSPSVLVVSTVPTLAYHIVCPVAIRPPADRHHRPHGVSFIDYVHPLDRSIANRWKQHLQEHRRMRYPSFVYTFDVYSSTTNKWEFGMKGTAYDPIIDISGVSCSRYAYWLSFEKVVYYDVVERKRGVMNLPSRFDLGKCQNECFLQLGIGEGNRLILMMGADDELAVYSLAPNRRNWIQEYHLEFKKRYFDKKPLLPFPLRSWSFRFQAVFAVDRGLLVWEKGRGRLRFLPMSTQVLLSVPNTVPVVITALRPQDAFS